MIRALLPLCLAVLLIAGCAGDAVNETAVVANDTATVEATSLPTSTVEPAATHTIRPTSSPTVVPPTATMRPTATPTDTPAPTETPTATPEPTETPTVAPPATSLPAPTSAPATPAIDAAAILRGQLNDVIAEVGNYRWIIAKPFGLYINPTAAIDCNATVQSHDRIVTLISVDVSGSAPAVQNAYATALQGVDQFILAAGPWTDSCRQALAMGNETNIMNQLKYAEMRDTLSASEALWNQAIHMLDE